MTRLSAFIEGVGLLGPGLNQWPHAAALLTGQAPYAPERTALPPVPAEQWRPRLQCTRADDDDAAAGLA
ncbi:beta-ketoacyl synthase chain length factor, partial [Ralstonia pseudosolanacearum]